MGGRDAGYYHTKVFLKGLTQVEKPQIRGKILDVGGFIIHSSLFVAHLDIFYIQAILEF